jgi:hypothetical protein
MAAMLAWPGVAEDGHGPRVGRGGARICRASCRRELRHRAPPSAASQSRHDIPSFLLKSAI